MQDEKRGGGEGFDPGRYDYINPGTRDNHAIATSIRMAPIMQNPGPTPQWLAVKEGTGWLEKGICELNVSCLWSPVENGGKYGKQGGCKRGFLRVCKRGREKKTQSERVGESDDLAEICDKGSNLSRLTQGTPRENWTKRT